MRNHSLLAKLSSRYKLRRTSPWFKSVSVSTTFVFICAQLTTALPVYAGPTGGEVVGGQGNIDQQGLTTSVNQHSNRLAVDWKTFNVAENESVQFVQPGRNSIALNRIHDQKASEIHGRIDANGNVLLINTRGVIFGRSAVVNVGGLVASALDLDPNEFMNNTSVQFSALENTEGLVVNQGLIEAATGGSVALLGKTVRNEGVISAVMGQINLVAGSEAVVTFEADGMIGVEVTRETLENDLGLDSAVLNEGRLDAVGGQVLMSAKVSRDLFSNAVNNTGIIQAKSIQEKNGVIYLNGTGAGVTNSGTVDVSSIDDGVDAGNIQITGDHIAQSGVVRADAALGNGGSIELNSHTDTILTVDSQTTANSQSNGVGGEVLLLGSNVGVFDQSTVSASGAQGGGRILIGGDKQGQNPSVKNANAIFIGESTKVAADATTAGDGGTVIAYAENSARIYGYLSARGGDVSGDGGFVEASGKKYLSVSKAPDMGASNGLWGTWLIDPYDLSIVSGNGNTNTSPSNPFDTIGSGASLGVELIKTALNGNGAVVDVTTGSAGGETGDITWDAAAVLDFDGTGSGTLNIKAADDIIFDGRIEDTDPTNLDQLTVNFETGYLPSVTPGQTQAVVFGSGALVQTMGGNFTSTSLTFNGSAGTIDTTGRIGSDGGDITVSSQGSLITGAIIGKGSDSNTNNGRNGGAIQLKTIGAISVGSISNSGGNGASNRTGGNAGTLEFGDAAANPSPIVPASIQLSGDINASGGTGGTDGNGAAVTFNAPVTLADLSGDLDSDGSITISTTGNNDGTITFENTLNTATGATAPVNLKLQAGSADIAFNNSLGSARRIGDLAIVSANNVTFDTAAVNGLSLDANSLITQNTIDNFTSSGATAVAVNTSGINDASGGAITINANNAIEISTANTSGGADIANAGGHSAGAVTLTANSVAINVITATGGSTNAANQAGGNGGAVNVTANTQAIDISGNIDTSAGASTASGSGGNAGAVNLTASAGQLTVTNITAKGGDAVSGNGGQGGAVTLLAQNSIRNNGNIDTSGGSVNQLTGDGLGGGGGVISLNSTNVNNTVINGNLVSAGGAGAGAGADTFGNGGDITLDENVILAKTGSAVIISTGEGSGNINFNRDINGQAAGQNDLTLTAGSGNINLGNGTNDDVGNNDALGDVIITSANDMRARGVFNAASITQNAGTGTSRFDGAVSTSGENGIDLTGTAFNFQNNILSNNTGTNVGGDVRIQAGGAITLGGTITTQSAVANSGHVNLQSGASLTVGNAVNTSAGGGVTINLTNDADDTLIMSQSINTASGDFEITDAGDVTVTGPISTSNGNITVLNSTSFDNTNVQGALSAGDGNVEINSSGAIALGNIVTTGSGTLHVDSSGGAISQSSNTSLNLNIAGNASFTATDGVQPTPNYWNVTLSNANNSFGGAVSVTGQDVVLTEAGGNAIQLGASTVSNDLTITGGNNQISQTGAVSVGGLTTIDAGANTITLNDSNNDFNQIDFTNDGAVSITDSSDIEVVSLDVGTGSINISANGLSQSGSIVQSSGAGDVTLNGGTGAIDLTHTGNEFIGTVIIQGGAQADIWDTSDLTIGPVTLAGNLTATADDNITLNNLISLAENAGVGNGTLTLNSGRSGNDTRIDLGPANLTVGNVVVSGGNGEDTLFVNHDNKIWIIDGANTGEIPVLNGVRDNTEGASPALQFSDIEILQGGDGEDAFRFDPNGSLTTADGGGGANDQVDLSGQDNVDITIGGDLGVGTTGIVNIEGVRGNAARGGSSILRANLTEDNTWTIDSANSGLLEEDNTNESIAFTDFNHLVGGGAKDAFDFEGSGSISGSINGGGSNTTADTIDVSSLASDHQWYLGIGAANCTMNCNRVEIDTATPTVLVGDFYGVSTVIAGSGGDTFNILSDNLEVDNISAGDGADDTIVGADIDNTLWDISNNYQGQISRNAAQLYSFTGVENLQGGTLSDTFDLSSNAQMNAIDGGAGAGTDVIIGGDGNKQWQLRANNVHQLQDGVNNKITDFSGMESLSAGANNDLFIFEDNAQFTGTINGGGGGQNELDFSQYTSAVAVNLDNQSASGVNGGAANGFNNISVFTGGSQSDLITGYSAGGDWIIDGDNSGSINDNLATFSGFENLTGLDGQDDFEVTSTGTVDGLVSGGGGDDSLTVNYSAAVRNFQFDGNTGADSVVLSGNASGFESQYVYDVFAVNQLTNTTNVQTVVAQNIDNFDDQTTADALSIQGTVVNDAFSINGNSVSIADNMVAIDFVNKTDVAINAGVGDLDLIDVAGDLTVSGSISLDAERITNSSGSVLNAGNNLTISNARDIGSDQSALRTAVSGLQIINNTANAYISEQDSVTLLASDVAGDFHLTTSSGSVTGNEVLTVGGQSVFTGGDASSFTLNNAANNLAGPVAFNAGTGTLANVVLVNNRDIELQSVNSNTLNVSANGDINGVGAVSATGFAQFDANGNNITLNDTGNDFGVFSAGNVNQLTVVDQNSIGIQEINATDSVITAQGQIADANGNATNFNGNSINLNAADGIGSGNSLETSVASLNVNNSDLGNIQIDNSGNLTIAGATNTGTSSGSISITTSGTLTQSGAVNSSSGAVGLAAGNSFSQQANIRAANNVDVTANNGAITMRDGTRTDSNGATIRYSANQTVTVSSIDAVFGQGTVELTSDQGSILSSRLPDRSRANVTGNIAVFNAEFGSLGEPGRPLVVNVPGTVVINTFASVTPIYITQPAQILDTSRVLFNVNEAKAEVGGSQRTEVDALAVIDPAVFTGVKNYSEDQYPVKLPSDQLYAEDEEEEEKAEDPDIFDSEKSQEPANKEEEVSSAPEM